MNGLRHLRMPGFLVIAILSLVAAGCGHHAAAIYSKRDIFWTSSSEHQIVIGTLPLKDWPKLKKFPELTDIDVAGDVAQQIDDSHLKTLSQLELPKLRNVLLAHCTHVTDRGLESLTNFPSISGLQLIDTSITDKGMQILATEFPKLNGISVEQCHAITSAGFMTLTNSRTIKDVGLSLDPLSQEQIENIISTVTNVVWWTISDPQQRLDHVTLRQLGESRKITIQVADKDRAVRSITRYP
jgi:hypothetical protein